MADLPAELLAIASTLRDLGTQGDADEIVEPLRRLLAGAEAVGASWSGSLLGYHARVYYADFQKVPPGARWSKEWGFYPAFSNEGVGDWREYSSDEVIAHIRTVAGDPDLKPVEEESEKARKAMDHAKGEIDSILATFLNKHSDELVRELREHAQKARAMTQQQAQQAYLGGGASQVITRDMQAIGEGWVLAPHLVVQARVIGLKAPFSACEELAAIATRASAHLARLEQTGAADSDGRGNRVFIGHGHSPLWRELKDFVHERLGLSYDEFNRVPTAGVATTARLAKMVDAAGFAFLILTAEDEQADGTEVARQNVVHEVGLFQGHLGNERAILMLEEGCAEFSNVQGLGQIRFPKDNIRAAFEEVRQVLEREGVVGPEGG
jgi:predicted nucleotide-binding protein